MTAALRVVLCVFALWTGHDVIAGMTEVSAASGGMASIGQPPPQEEFVPIDQLPPEDRLPAAPLLVGAYVIVWVGLMGYLWSIWRRLQKVESELTDVASRLNPRERRP